MTTETTKSVRDIVIEEKNRVTKKVDFHIGIYNTIGYGAGTTGSFAYSATPCDIGIHNTRSNNDNAINIQDLFDPSGFIYDPNLFIPNY